MLLTEFTGQTLQMKDIFEKHHVGKRYISRNYKEVLVKLESMDKIIVDPPATKRKKHKGKVTFGDKVKVTFP